MPDIIIEEMIEKDKSSPSPYLKIKFHGFTEYRNDQVVVSTCRLTVYKFPFDTQSCNISFKSVLHSDKEIELYFIENNTAISEMSRRAMRTQYEWLFVNIISSNKTQEAFGFNQTIIVYTLAVDGESSEKVCSYQDVLNYLNLTSNNELFSMTRPVKDHKQSTEVSLELLLYAILDVKEIDQTFVPYVWILMKWQNDYISWDPRDFCGITNVSLPTQVLWKPDLTIEEMIEKDKAPPSPLLTIDYNGTVFVQNDQVLVSTCRMHVYKFPFDTQSCTLSFKSVVHSVTELRLVHHWSSSETTEWSRELMRTQYEWLFLNMKVTNKSVTMFGAEQDMIVYTISMKRRSLLYVINFLLPVFFFLCLDLASFLISDKGGEKLSFKVTVLLAVTVMQLILNEILPSSSNRIPLIVVYCIGIFGMMLLSLLETIVVVYLMEKDSASQNNETDRGQSLNKVCGGQRGKSSFSCCEGEEKKWTPCGCICDASADETTPAELLKERSSQLTEEPNAFEKVSDELKDVVKTLILLLSSRKEEEKPGYWTRKTETINKAYFIFYITAASLFLLFMFFNWNHA
ncbi:5-hydroxytryptamine receptor 3A-like [Stegastes partitus]|uniref:5-hydroxytryptamine receptor 3A-like n=1 Tax=Stegastes partitus TaxID=144197 RepID=A0A9Y4KGJ8_9TELE|nr:PREDICTED: 5-hydroxytryptamine receptor 3A-like [Stegastes partitus]